MDVRICVQQEDFDVGIETARLRDADRRVGAVAVFVGTVREMNEDAVSDEAAGKTAVRTMSLEHYPGMTEKSLQAIVDEAGRRFDVFGATVIHRIGELRPLDQIVLVAVKSAHRGEAFDACRFIMDYLKTQAPFWKKEVAADGTAHWVDARDSDDAALARWQRNTAPDVRGD